MRFSTANIDITPPIGLPIGGNIRNDYNARGIHDNLFCNIILLENDKEVICFLGMDLLGLQYENCRFIKAEIEKKSGIKRKNIIITTTHTHSGPDVTDIFKNEMDEGCARYIEGIANKISTSVKLLLEKLEEATIGVTKKSIYDLSFNRRLIMQEGSMRMNWEDIEISDVDREAGPIDPLLHVIPIYDKEEKIKVIMINFTLHPAILVGKDWLWSRDYINYLDEYLKHVLGNDIVVFFANGAEGNINHINFRDKNQRRGFEEAERIGEALGRHVVEALNNVREIESLTLRCESEIIKLPLRTISEDDIKKAKELLEVCSGTTPSLLDGVPDEIYASEIIKLSKNKNEFVETEIQVIKLGDIVITTLPGEVFVEFGLQIKQLSGYKDTLVFGLTNDFIGYIPTQIAFVEGGYEIKTATTSKLHEMAGDRLVEEVIKLINKL